MRACFVAFFALALAACSARQGETEVGNLLPASQPRQAGALSNVAPARRTPPEIALNRLPPEVVLNSLAPEVALSRVAPAPKPPRGAELVPAPQTAQVSSLGGLVGAPADATDLFASSSAYAPRVADRTYVTLTGYSPGTVVVRTKERRLYLVLNDGQALRYPVAVGKAGQEWTGTSHIYSKRIKPPWSPPQVIKRDSPTLPDVIPGGSPSNPMGDAALLIAGGEYAIHGTNRPESIGRFVSYGCIRMYNEDVMDLYRRVLVGTPIVVER